MDASWTIALAVKPLAGAKSRLSAQLAAGERGDLVVAMARDVVRAALATASVRQVLVVTADPQVAAALEAEGAAVVREHRVAGLDAAYRLAVDRVGRTPLALLMADLPALTPGVLQAALSAVPADQPAVVADAEGDGTTMLAARDARVLVPRFGPHSRRRHRAGGAVDITADCSARLRQDVDTWTALAELRAAGEASEHTADWFSVRPAGVA